MMKFPSLLSTPYVRNLYEIQHGSSVRSAKSGFARVNTIACQCKSAAEKGKYRQGDADPDWWAIGD
jgi:hypothetical protein